MPQETLKRIIEEVRATPRVSTPLEVMALMRNRFSNRRKAKKKTGDGEMEDEKKKMAMAKDGEADDGDEDGDEPDGDGDVDGDDGDGAKDGEVVTLPHGDLAPEVPEDANANKKVVA